MSEVMEEQTTKPGYKKTKLGWIPEEWDEGQLNDIVESLVAGVSVNSDDVEPFPDKIGVLKTSSLNAGKFLPNKSKTVIPKDKDRVKEHVEEGTVMISRMNTPNLVGENAIALRTHSNLFLPDRIWKTKYTREDTFDKLWLGYLFQTKFLKGRFGKIATGTSGSMKNISKRDVLISHIPLPPLPEQRQIAHILSTWEKAIDTLQKLIAKKQERKKGLMQQLLSGKKRFAGFDGEWKEVRLGDKTKCFSGGTPSRSNSSFYGGSVPWIKSGELNTARITATEESITEEGLRNSSAKIVEPETLLIALYGATAGVVSITTISAAINQAVLAVLPDEGMDKYFLYYLLKMRMAAIVHKMVQGGQPNLSGSIVKSLKILLPKNLEEQQKIASVLSAADREIEKLQGQLEKLQEQKRGLMQKLLTGEVRVKIEKHGKGRGV